jgi:hypothetical protein
MKKRCCARGERRKKGAHGLKRPGKETKKEIRKRHGQQVNLTQGHFGQNRPWVHNLIQGVWREKKKRRKRRK